MTTWGRLAAFLAISAALILALQFAQAEQAQPVENKDPKNPKVNTELLGGVDRYLTHVSTDKPIYRPGEHLYARGVVLHAHTNKPRKDNVPALVEIIGPKGDVIAAGTVNSEVGVPAFDWLIPESMAGGQYTVKFSQPWSGDAPAERKFDIRVYRAPRLRSQIKFLRDGYGPGDDVVGTLEVSRAEGGIPAGAKVTVIARVDGGEAFRGESVVDKDGHCVARFKLPAEIARGEGSLAMVVEDGGVVETASKTIPILLQTVDLTMYPEGGELVAGVPNRVYIEAFTPAKKPADLAGVIVDGAGKEVATFRSQHEGRGRFTFTPAAGNKYQLKITEPIGIHTTYRLPEVKAHGVALSSLQDVASERVRVQLASPTDAAVILTLNKREQELGRREINLKAGVPSETEFSAVDANGVLITTVWDKEGMPLAERLIFSKPRHDVRVSILADRPRYVPGGKATLTLTTTDELGKPTSAVVGLAVTDDSVLEMIERREQAPRLPVMALLEADVKDLADAQVYLDSQNPEAPAAVDLLLGTQGWRRFALVELPKFLRANGDAARRSLALTIITDEVRLHDRRGGGGFGGGGFGDVVDGPRGERFFWADKSEGAAEGQAAALAVDIDLDVKRNLNEAGAMNIEALDLGGVAGPVPAAAAEPVANQPVEIPAATPPAQAEELGAERQVLAGALQDLDKDVSEREVLGNRGRGAASRFAKSIAREDFAVVRVFAHHARPDRAPGERTDFAETLYWHAGLKTDGAGKATVEFDLNDAVTSFRVFADAFSELGSLGSGTHTIESVEPFYVEPKLPLEVTSGDLVLAPVGMVNGTDAPLTATVSANIPGRSADDDGEAITLPADGRVRYMLRLPIGDDFGAVPVTLSAKAAAYTDKVTRTMQVKPLGFPQERGGGGLIEANSVVYETIEIPETVVPGSITAKAVVYPTPLANMTEAMARLIQEPSGCFEQTSSTIYPLVMAQQYFMEHQGVDPALVEKSADILERGYARLTGFESKGGGYEWFGADPGHDALTAYGLMEFTDMARVRNVDTKMLDRTRKWFLEQRDGKGGFARKANTLHTWLPDPEVANAYNTWALYQAGIEGDFTTEVKWVREAAKSTPNTYVVALAANIVSAAGVKEARAQLLDKLAGLQQKDGSLSGATVSVVGSTGDALAIETTALAVLAWLDDKAYTQQVEHGIKFLAEACKAGRFGSTQSTVLALKAITAYDRARAVPKAPGELQLVVDGEHVGDAVAFTTETQGAIELPDFTKMLTPGKHQIELHMTGGSDMPISVAASFFATKPDSSDACKLKLAVSLAERKVSEGELTEARVTVTNRSKDVIPSPIAIIGIPGGLEVRHDQLKELVKSGKIATYEVLGRDLVLYWRSLAANEKVELPVSVVAAVPGRYTGPASRAYLYYTDEDKTWTDPLRVEIAARN